MSEQDLKNSKFREDRIRLHRIQLFKDLRRSNFICCHPEFKTATRIALRKLVGKKQING